ncbi:MAG: RNA polymerase sigma factor [Puniceicoccaceae bacterium]
MDNTTSPTETPLPLDSDAIIMERISQGDRAALISLIDNWKQPLLSFFYRSTGSFADAEELTFNTFDRLYRAAPRYRPSAKFSSFVFTIARNLLISRSRTLQRRPKLVENTPLLEPADPDQTAISDLRDSLDLALTSLQEKYRTPLLLHVQQGLDYEEISKALNLSHTNVKVRIHRARQMLKTKLESLS